MPLTNTVGISDIPSHFSAVLRSLIGHRISEATRYSWWAPDEVQQECGVNVQDTFSLTAGPVAIAFDTGIVLGITSAPSFNSVSIWIEKNESGQSVREEPLATDEELHPISAADPKFADQFWRSVIGSKVNAVSVLIRRPSSAILAELPNEVGICFSLDSGEKVIAAHGLHDDSDDFAIIPDHMIMPGLRSELQELRIAA